MGISISFTHFLAGCLLITLIIFATAVLIFALSAKKTFEKIDVLVDLATDTTNKANEAVTNVYAQIEQKAEVIEKVAAGVATSIILKKMYELFKTLKSYSKSQSTKNSKQGKQGKTSGKACKGRGRKRGRR